MNERLDPALEALLDAERGRPGADEAARGRVLERVQASIAVHPPSGVAPKMGPAASVAGTLLRPVLGAALLLGVGTAAVVLATRAHPAAPPVVQAPTVPATASEPVVPPPPVVPSDAPDPVVVAPEPRVAPSSPAPPVSTLPAERALLDRARKDLLSGEPQAALEEVEKHARLYRHGVLGEEREALRVEALVAAQRYEPARAAGARFRAAYPGSMLGPAVEDALGTIP
jgi:hypothetical protein